MKAAHAAFGRMFLSGVDTDRVAVAASDLVVRLNGMFGR